MNAQLNLKELERKAFRSTFQDGLLDILLGLIVICLAFTLFRPDTGYGPLNILLEMIAFPLAFLIFFAGKWFITRPRMGQVEFGPARKRKWVTLAIILGVVVAVQAGIILLSVAGRHNPELGAKINAFLQEGNLEHLAMAAVGSLFVGPSMILVAFFIDYPRGYYIAILMALAVFLMLYLNQPIYPIIIGFLITLPGLVLLVRFLQKYPLRWEEAPHE